MSGKTEAERNWRAAMTKEDEAKAAWLAAARTVVYREPPYGKPDWKATTERIRSTHAAYEAAVAERARLANLCPWEPKPLSHYFPDESKP